MSERRLIEDWLPIASLSAEATRERRIAMAGNVLPPTTYMHIWFARRPLVASRAAILGSLLPANADRGKFLHDLGIHGDPVAAMKKMLMATVQGVRLGDTYGYPRAWRFTPEPQALGTVLDPTSGGGSIPLEAVRLGCDAIANDLNPVAALLLKTTVELPLNFGSALAARFEELAAEFIRRARPHFADVFPQEAKGVLSVEGYLWARTVTCPYCGGLVPLSPNWKLSGSGHGVRLIPENGRMRFQIVDRESDHSQGTVKGGDASCPFPDCRRTIESEEIKTQARSGNLGHQLYCIVYKEERANGFTKTGKPKTVKVRGFRAPRPEDEEVEALVRQKLAERMPLWHARNIVPDEEFPADTNDDRPIQYGAPLWRDLFNTRQLFGHCVGVEVFQEMVDQCAKTELDRAAMTYIALALDKMLDFNCVSCTWVFQREVIGHSFQRHDFSFRWSYAEMAPVVAGFGYEWVISQVGKALHELIDLLGQSSDGKLQFATLRPKPKVQVTCMSGDSLAIADASVDCVVMDPPYYDNVMYAELADFFYVWLKRTAGVIYPDLFVSHLTDKDREAVANPAKFAGQKGGAKNLAGREYQRRMASIFTEQRRVLKPDGIMTVMFTHKAAGAWDALTTGLIEAGFTITASWPVNTEFEASMHIIGKSAARSTIFLVCRVREVTTANAESRYWEEVEPTVRQAVRVKLGNSRKLASVGSTCISPVLVRHCRYSPKHGRSRGVLRVHSRRQSRKACSRSSILTQCGRKMRSKQRAAK